MLVHTLIVRSCHFKTNIIMWCMNHTHPSVLISKVQYDLDHWSWKSWSNFELKGVLSLGCVTRPNIKLVQEIPGYYKYVNAQVFINSRLYKCHYTYVYHTLLYYSEIKMNMISWNNFLTLCFSHWHLEPRWHSLPRGGGCWDDYYRPIQLAPKLGLTWTNQRYRNLRLGKWRKSDRLVALLAHRGRGYMPRPIVATI